MNYTKGPWTADNKIMWDDDDIPTIAIWGPKGPGYGRVGTAYPECGSIDDLRGNALMQAAALELLEALEAMVKCYGISTIEGDTPISNKARAAIAKAKGEK